MMKAHSQAKSRTKNSKNRQKGKNKSAINLSTRTFFPFKLKQNLYLGDYICGNVSTSIQFSSKIELNVKKWKMSNFWNLDFSLFSVGFNHVLGLNFYQE